MVARLGDGGSGGVGRGRDFCSCLCSPLPSSAAFSILSREISGLSFHFLYLWYVPGIFWGVLCVLARGTRFVFSGETQS